MAGAHGVEVELLHQNDFLAHIFDCQRPSAHGMVFVAIHATHDQPLPVHQHQSVFYLHLAEAHRAAFEVNCHPLGVVEGQHQAVQVGGFSSPQARVGDGVLNMGAGGFG